MEMVIWFDTIEQHYELGSMSDYLVAQEYKQEEFDILYEFNSYTKSIAQKVVDRLNDARVESVAA
ncbi:MAG: hypothetical protein NXI20_12720 [bacterium]|nr:hypothetical protein [bacterium]